MPLAPLPKAFGLTGAIAKESFPHLSNTPENQNYFGPLPPIEYNCPETLRTAEREKLYTWHRKTTNAGYVFDFLKEIVKYCTTDVAILRRACVVLCKTFITNSNVCLFERERERER